MEGDNFEVLLLVLKVQRQGVEVSGDRPLNLVTASNIATFSSHCKRFSKESVVPSTQVIENAIAKPNSVNSSASCQNLALNTSKFAISVLPDTQFLDTSLKNKNDSERNNETDDDDSVDMPLGDASLLNDLSIFEYFEPYQHISILEEEIVDVANETEIEEEKRMLRKRPYTTTRLSRSPLLENGYRADDVYNNTDVLINMVATDDLEKENFTRKKNAESEIVKNKNLKTRGLRYKCTNGSTSAARSIRERAAAVQSLNATKNTATSLENNWHSHMEVDSIHAAIERSKKRSTIDIETPRDWALFISQVRRKIPINVVELDQTKFLALKNLNIRFNRPKYNTDGPVIKLRDIICGVHGDIENLGDALIQNHDVDSTTSSKLKFEDLDEDCREVCVGSNTIMNEFDITDYFEKFRNESLLSDDAEYLPDTDKCNNAGPSGKLPGDFGFQEMIEPEAARIKEKCRRIINHTAKTKGQSYIRDNGTVVPVRAVKPACNCTKLKCKEKYSEDVRRQLLQNMLELTASGQNQFLSNHMALRTTARPTVLNSRRFFTRSYYLPAVNDHETKNVVLAPLATEPLPLSNEKMENLKSTKVVPTSLT
ncbi:uncharacterized protein LOC129717212 [Wyeomyia smithii]|uniref:uncharacterized protein LOC129717212 n=1 Tax=Wyeomyia smithii TaxID=174621 RepID=UPI002468223D|nr:uncharacterized protein LOC129717212 [Wyeomyia smithii]